MNFVGRIGRHDELVDHAVVRRGGFQDFNVNLFPSKDLVKCAILLWQIFLSFFMSRAGWICLLLGVLLCGLFLRTPQSGQGLVAFSFLMSGKLGFQVCLKRGLPTSIRIIFLSFLIVLIDLGAAGRSNLRICG
jgi:hypothetical protein